MRRYLADIFRRRQNGVLSRLSFPPAILFDTSTTNQYDYSTTTTHLSDVGSSNNPGLESIISQGRASLERTAYEIQHKTKRTKPLPASEDNTHHKSLTHRQLSEAERILTVATECIEAYCEKEPNNFWTIRGEPLVLLQVQVNSNGRLAKVFWTLPYGILLDLPRDKNHKMTYSILVEKVKRHLQERGAEQWLSRQVHSRLRSYYAPRLRLQVATNEMVAQAMSELLLLDDDDANE